jgi:hypothetical protein
MCVESLSEFVLEVRRTESNKLLLIVEKGDSSYQYVYREAVGVYWNEEMNGFESTAIKEWDIRRWYDHILKTVKDTLGVELILKHDVQYSGLTQADVNEIQSGDAN